MAPGATSRALLGTEGLGGNARASRFEVSPFGGEPVLGKERSTENIRFFGERPISSTDRAVLF